MLKLLKIKYSMITNLKFKILSIVISLVFASAVASQSSSNDYQSEEKTMVPVELILLGVLGSRLSSS
jgi:hypothetical protein